MPAPRRLRERRARLEKTETRARNPRHPLGVRIFASSRAESFRGFALPWWKTKTGGGTSPPFSIPYFILQPRLPHLCVFCKARFLGLFVLVFVFSPGPGPDLGQRPLHRSAALRSAALPSAALPSPDRVEAGRGAALNSKLECEIASGADCASSKTEPPQFSVCDLAIRIAEWRKKPE
jgi:hypothetical protein